MYQRVRAVVPTVRSCLRGSTQPRRNFWQGRGSHGVHEAGFFGGPERFQNPWQGRESRAMAGGPTGWLGGCPSRNDSYGGRGPGNPIHQYGGSMQGGSPHQMNFRGDMNGPQGMMGPHHFGGMAGSNSIFGNNSRSGRAMENIPGSSCGPWGMTGQDTFSEMRDREQHGMGPRWFGGLESSNGNFGGRFHDGERHCGTMSRSVHPNGLNDPSLYTTPNTGNSQQNMFGGWYERNEAPEAFTPSGRRDYSSGNFNQGASFENMNSRGFQGGRPTQMDSVERNFFGDNPLRCVGPRSVAIGNEKDFINSSFYINIDAHGLKPEDLTIGFRDGKMNVAAFKATTKEDGTKTNEMVVREFKLPANVDESSLKSYLQDGILTVEGTLVKKEEEREIPGGRPGERPSDEGPTMEN